MNDLHKLHPLPCTHGRPLYPIVDETPGVLPGHVLLPVPLEFTREDIESRKSGKQQKRGKPDNEVSS